MEALAVALLIPFIKKVIDFIRYARARDANGVVTQLIVWLAAVIIILIAARTNFASIFAFNEFSLATINFWSQLFLGFLLGSSASLTQDLFKSISRNATAIPTLLPPTPVVVVPAVVTAGSTVPAVPEAPTAPGTPPVG